MRETSSLRSRLRSSAVHDGWVSTTRHSPRMAVLWLLLAVPVLLGATGCEKGSTSASSSAAGGASSGARTIPATPGSSSATAGGSATAPVPPPKPVSRTPMISLPPVLGSEWRPVVTIAGQSAAWVAQRSGVTLIRFDQQLVHLALHAGAGERAGRGWRSGEPVWA